MKFSIEDFNTEMKSYDIGNLVANSWETKKGTDNLLMEYTYTPTPNDVLSVESFRTWEQESSSPNIRVEGIDGGLIVTCKIDYVRPDKHLDDHIILMTGFLPQNNVPTLCFAQVMVQYTANEGHNVSSGAITKGNIIDGIVNYLNDQIKYLPQSIPPQNGFGNDVLSPKGWQYFPYIVRANLECIAKSVH